MITSSNINGYIFRRYARLRAAPPGSTNVLSVRKTFRERRTLARCAGRPRKREMFTKRETSIRIQRHRATTVEFALRSCPALLRSSMILLHEKIGRQRQLFAWRAEVYITDLWTVMSQLAGHLTVRKHKRTKPPHDLLPLR